MYSYACGSVREAEDCLYCVAAQDMNKCGDATPNNTAVDRYLEDEYFYGIYLLCLMIIDLVLLGYCARF